MAVSGGVTADVEAPTKGNNGPNGNGDLTGLQRAFVEAWFACRYNGTKAAKQAGYQGDEGTLATQSWRLLRMAKIKAAIGERFASGVTPQEVVNVLADQMRGSVADFLDDHGNVDIEKVRSDEGRLVASYTEASKDGNIKLVLYSSQKAAELIGKIQGQFGDGQGLPQTINVILEK